MKLFFAFAALACLALADDSHRFHSDTPCTYHIIKKNDQGQTILEVKGYNVEFEDLSVIYMTHKTEKDDSGKIVESILRSDLSRYAGHLYVKEEGEDCFEDMDDFYFFPDNFRSIDDLWNEKGID